MLNTRACDWFWQFCLSSTWTKLPVYKCGTEAPVTHIIPRFANNFVFKAWAVGDNCLLKWRKCVFWYILLFLCLLEPFTQRVMLVSTIFRQTYTFFSSFSFWKLIIKYACLLREKRMMLKLAGQIMLTAL